MGQRGRHEGFGDQRTDQHLPDGLHAGAGILLVHGSYHRHAACADHDDRQLAGACRGYAGLCPGPGAAVHALCDVPLVAEVGSEVGFMDDDAEGGARLHRAGLLAKVPLRSRSGIRLAYPRPRGVPVAVDCHLRPLGCLPLRMAEVPGR